MTMVGVAARTPPMKERPSLPALAHTEKCASGTGNPAHAPAKTARVTHDHSPAHPARPLFAAGSPVSTPDADDAAPERRARYDGWSLEKQRQFCEVLASTGNVAQAADAVGMSRRSAYAFRKSSTGRAFARLWDQARDLACRAVVDEAVALAFQGRTVQVIENGEVVTERHRNSPARLLRTVERLRSDEVLGDPTVVAAARDFERCLDLLEAGDAFPVPPVRDLHGGVSAKVHGIVRRFLMGEMGVEASESDTATSPTTRHPELVSGSMVPLGPLGGNDTWMLKRVQHDDGGVDGASPRDEGGMDRANSADESEHTARPHRWSPTVQRAFCEALAQCGNVDKACRAVGKGRTGAYALRNHPEGQAFAIAWDAALLVVSEEMMDMALEMAREGSVDMVYRKGKLIRVRRTSDAQVMLDTVARVSAMRGGLANAHINFAENLDLLESGEALRAIEAGIDEDEDERRGAEIIDSICRATLGENYADYDWNDDLVATEA